jgi:Bacterial archaeo-eukaryotic release factor family 5
MIPDPETLQNPGDETVAELLAWRPEHGVVSLYLDTEPGDRGGKWRIEARNGMSAAGDEITDHDAQTAWRATAGRLEEDLAAELPGDVPRALIGFVEVSREPGEERWYRAELAPHRTDVARGPVAHVHPLLEMLDDGAPLGIAAVSSERVRLIDWRLGHAKQLHDWELEVFALEWRERKAQMPRDPARGQAVSASGRDQYDERLEANRERFAKQTGELARAEAKKHGWRSLLDFGDGRYERKFAAGFGDSDVIRHVSGADLISEPTAKIEARVEELLPGLNRERERALIGHIKEAAYAQARSAFGLQETLQSLEEGRVEHLVYDSGREYREPPPTPEVQPLEDGLPVVERMVELALSTSAAVTPVEGDSAAELEEQDGVIALLRY